jgi:hypothetical protein
LADLAGVTVKAVGVLEYERRWPHPHAVRSLADASRLGDADRAALVAAPGCQPCRSAPSGIRNTAVTPADLASAGPSRPHPRVAS